MKVSLTVNGVPYQRDVEPRTLLVDLIRDDLGLTGTNVGCDTTQCGSCTIHLNGDPVKCCTLLAVQANGAEVTTIEGLGRDGELHPMQRAFREQHGLQCGYCTPGMIMMAIGLVESHEGELTERDVRRGLDGNLCRCTGYENIVDAVLQAAGEMRGGEAAGVAGGEARGRQAATAGRGA